MSYEAAGATTMGFWGQREEGGVGVYMPCGTLVYLGSSLLLLLFLLSADRLSGLVLRYATQS